MNTLKAEGISKSFGSRQVVHPMSLEFHPGTVTAIVGDNGAGKSTLLKILAGVHQADAGRVILGGKPLPFSNPEAHRREGIEMVYQDLALAPHHDVVSNLFLGRERKRALFFVDQEKMVNEARAILSQLEISISSLEMKVGKLSGGQQQAIAIARAVLFNPKVLLLDEPTAALAAREVGKVLELIRREREEQRVVILVSHRLNDVFAVADRIIVLKQGSLSSDDPAASVSLPEIVQRIVN